MLVVLTLITIIAAGVLAAVNAVTAPQIDKINADNLAAGNLTLTRKMIQSILFLIQFTGCNI